MDRGVVIDPPEKNRWALAGAVVAGLIAGAGFFLIPVFEGMGVPFRTILITLAFVEGSAGIACVYFVMHLHPEDAEVERY